MIIRFLEDVELFIIEEYDEETDQIVGNNNLFLTGELVYVDIIGESTESMDFQFGDGSVAYEVLRSWFEFYDNESDSKNLITTLDNSKNSYKLPLP